MALFNQIGNRIAMPCLGVALAGLLAACGGGGGGGGGITYGGITDPAAVTPQSAEDFVANVTGGSSGIAAAGSFIVKPVEKPGDAVAGNAIVRAITTQVRTVLNRPSEAAQKAGSAKPFSDSFPGEVAGSATIRGDIDDNGLGHVNMRFSGFDDGEGILDGSVSAVVVAFDEDTGVLDMQMNVPRLRFIDDVDDLSISGRVDATVQVFSDRMLLLMNVDGRDNLTDESVRMENMQVDIRFDELLSLFPCEETMSFSGRLYVSQWGYVDVTTASPLVFDSSGCFQAYPNRGGPLRMVGNGGSQAEATPLSASTVRVQVDADGDGTFDDVTDRAWDDLGL